MDAHPSMQTLQLRGSHSMTRGCAARTHARQKPKALDEVVCHEPEA
jgi:hypothetical protein